MEKTSLSKVTTGENATGATAFLTAQRQKTSRVSFFFTTTSDTSHAVLTTFLEICQFSYKTKQ